MSCKLNGVTLHVRSLEDSLQFYRTLFPKSAVRVYRPGLFALIQLENGRLGLLQRNDDPFYVEITAAEVDLLYERLTAAGVRTDGPPRRRRYERGFMVTDPDGHQIEFEGSS